MDNFEENRRCPIWAVHISCLTFAILVDQTGWGYALGAMLIATMAVGARNIAREWPRSLG